jgi:N-acyl amino acid synthase of PEP-CTERM/exosortase system
MLTLGDFKFVVATTPELLDGVFRLRYQVYVEEFGYEHAGDHPDGKETDEWDPFSIHMAALNPEGDVIGTIRLVLNSNSGLPTLNVAAPFYQDRNPLSRHIAEVSRLAVSRSFRRRVEDGFQGVTEFWKPDKSIAFHRPEENEFPSQERRKRFAVVLGLFKIMLHVSKRIDLKDWYMMAEKRLWYLLKRYHIVFNPIGPEIDYHGKRIPYHGHIVDVEERMRRKSESLAAAFHEGLETPPDSSAVEETPLPSIDEKTIQQPTPYFIPQGEMAPSAPPVPFSEEEAEQKARAAAEAVAEIVWPHRIPRRHP